MTPEQIVQRSVDTYNARDLDGFMATLSADVVLHHYYANEPIASGATAVRQLYADLFAASPNLHATILTRIAYHNTVIDHERIDGRLGATDPMFVVAIYDLEEEKIARLTVLRQ